MEKTTHEILEDLYLSPAKPSSLGGIDRLFREAKKKIPGIKRQDVVDFLQTQYAYTQHKPVLRKFSKRSVIATDINDVYQMDLVDMRKFSEFNDEYTFILTAIDCFTRYGFAVPIKSKKPQAIIDALVIIFKEYGIPMKVFSDNGTEFMAKVVKSFFKELGVKQWNSNNKGKAVVVERFNRTIKERLWTYMTDKNNYRYIDVLPDVVKSYNDSVHSSTGFAPSTVDNKEAEKILDETPYDEQPKKNSAFMVGDHVRISKEKLTFEKGYESNYTQLLFKIAEVKQSNDHYLYRIVDLGDEDVKGWFYEKELSKTVPRDGEKHRIANIVKTRKLRGRLQYLVNWAGYPKAFDSWEYADELK